MGFTSDTTAEQHDRFHAWWITGGLLLITLLSRIACLSAPYYVDGPNLVKAVQDGSLLIQPPGYFLFTFTAHALTALTGISASAAISGLNVLFSVGGVCVFREVTAELFPGLGGFLLACCYAVSNVVWFSAEIHSTYASTTFFGPLLFYILILRRSNIIAAWLIWAVMTGFRPSDGVFLVPLMIYFAARKPWRPSVIGLALAVPICLFWYVPTVVHFGGSVLSPFLAARRQLGQLPSGIAVQGLTAKSLNNLLHFLAGTINSWNLLLPFVCLGAFTKSAVRWPCVIWIVPASLFFAFYFVSDSLYLAFLVAPGMILAGAGLQRLWGPRAYSLLAAASVLAGCIHMLLLRPIPTRSVPTAVLNSYTLSYTRWALKNRYAKRLSSAIDELHRR